MAMMMKGVLLLLLGLAAAVVAGDDARAASFRHGGSLAGGYNSGGYKPWPRQYFCRQRGCFKPCPNPTPLPTAWQYISTNPKLTFLTKLLSDAGLSSVLDGPFDKTILAPTDEAWDNYFKLLSPALITILGNDAERTGPYWRLINSHFWPRLLNYHVLEKSVPVADLKVGTWYDTAYNNENGRPHKVQFNNQSAVAPRDGPTTNRYAKPCRSQCRSLKYYFRDEQNNAVPVEAADKLVQGGGVVHTLKAVLQPNDIFPSAYSALKFNNLTLMIKAIDDAASSTVGAQIWRFIETTPATQMTPNNDALGLLAGITVPPELLMVVINYHICPDLDFNPINLLYTPFTSGQNPCLTQLGIVGNTNQLLLKLTANPNTVSAMTTGQSAGIVSPDITTPLSVSHGIDSVLIPSLPTASALASKVAQRG